jgi:hypothetical protein
MFPLTSSQCPNVWITLLMDRKINVYLCKTMKVSEVDRVNGLNFLFKKCGSELGDFITRMEVGSFLISHLIICSQTYLTS